MSTQHTPGRLFVTESEEHWGRVNCHLTSEANQANIGSIWVNGTSQNRADARRLVACWNRLEQFTTEQIEDFGYDLFAEVRPHYERAMQEMRAMHAQRDELAKQLAIAVDVIKSEYPEHQWSDYGVPAMERAMK